MSAAPGRGPRHAARGDGYGRYVGRVGALAVALGIGAAIANNPGIALADEPDSSAGAVSADTCRRAADAPGATSDPAAPSTPKHRKPKVTFGSKQADEQQQDDPDDESGPNAGEKALAGGRPEQDRGAGHRSGAGGAGGKHRRADRSRADKADRTAKAAVSNAPERDAAKDTEKDCSTRHGCSGHGAGHPSRTSRRHRP